MGLLSRILDTTGLPPHGFCLLWQPGLIWLHVVSDAVIGISYYAIPLALGYFVSRRRDIADSWIFWLFASFILACTLWHPDYGVQGLIKAITAAVSLLTAIMLWPLVVRALALPTPTQFRLISNELAIQRGERDSALRRLEETEERFRLLVNGVTDHAIYMLDPTGRVSTWNTSAERMEGYREQEILGRHFSIFYTQQDRDAGLPARSLETAARDGRFEAEGLHIRKDGSHFWANAIINPLRDETGWLIGYAKVVRDITERRQSEEALRESQSAVAQLQKMDTIGQLAGGIAHDFNNLLTIVLGGASLLERDAELLESGDAREIVTTIADAAQRASTLTQQLLAFSRKQTLAPLVTDANRLITQMSELLRRTLGETVAIETVLAGGLWKTNVDTNQLENAILNLAVNARDAMPDGGKLTLETGNVYLDDAYAAAHAEVKPGQYIMVAVSDTGIGMTEDVMRRAFEPFFTTKGEGRGTGLGLSQVFGFVKQSGGHVKIYSEVGHGTTVKIYLPWHPANGAVAVVPELSYAIIPRGSETLLVVEDHDGVRGYVTNALGHLGYRVLGAPDGRRALDLLAEHSNIDLLLTDVGLPGLNGRQLAEQARQRLPTLKIVFMTGYARNAISHRGLLDVGVHLLPKPFTVEQLARKLREVLRGAG
jgi:PAS domain S-box-containing protein